MGLTHVNVISDILGPPAFEKYSMLGLSSIFLFNFFLHVFCNSTKTITNNSSGHEDKKIRGGKK